MCEVAARRRTDSSTHAEACFVAVWRVVSVHTPPDSSHLSAMSLLQRSVRAVAASRLAQVAVRRAAVVAAPKMTMHASASRAQAAAAPTGRLHPSEDLTLPQIQV